MIKILSFFTLIASAFAGLAPAHVAYHAPVSYHAPAPLAYAAQPAFHAAPVATYAAAPFVSKVHAAPAAFVKSIEPEPYDAHPQYNYGYSIQDGLTGDSKGHQESRDGDVVRGQYSLVEPDGAIRTVTYTADGINGFNAVVDRQAPSVAVAKVHAAPVAYAAAPGFAKVHHL